MGKAPLGQWGAIFTLAHASNKTKHPIQWMNLGLLMNKERSENKPLHMQFRAALFLLSCYKEVGSEPSLSLNTLGCDLGSLKWL